MSQVHYSFSALLRCFSLALVLSLSWTQAQAQPAVVDASVKVGGQSLKYDSDFGKSSGKFGFGFQGMFTYFGLSTVGFQAGLGFDMYNGDGTFNGSETFTEAVILGNDDTHNLEYTNKFYDLHETQTFATVSIPIGLAYRLQYSEKLHFTVDAGIKMLLPLVSKYKVDRGAVVTTAYDKHTDQILSDMALHGLDSTFISPSGKYNTTIGGALYFDASVRLKLTKGLSLYAAPFVEFGFSNLIKQRNHHLVDNGTRNYHGVLSYKGVDRVRPFGVGVKLGVSLPVLNAK